MLAKLTQKRLFSGGAPRRTQLWAFHKEKMGAQMVDFAGYHMPVKYPLGGLQEHLHCRASSGLFDVSHMGQVRVKGRDAANFLEKVTVVDTQNLAPGQASLSLIMLESGGIKDDCIVTKVADDDFYVVLNAGCKETDLAHWNAHKPADMDVGIHYSEENSLVAIQGPKSQELLERVLNLSPNAMTSMPFMTANFDHKFDGGNIIVSRCGYTGEDGFEVSVPNANAESFMEALLEPSDNNTGKAIAECVGLGARDSLRLEAGLCLYGHDISEDVSPVEGMLLWTISQRRRAEGGFLGYETVKRHIDEGVSRKRCGFVVQGKLPVREGAELWTKDLSTQVGVVTSGVPGPTFKQPVGMAYCDVPHNKFKTELIAKVRNKEIPVTVRKMPFVPANYHKV